MKKTLPLLSAVVLLLSMNAVMFGIAVADPYVPPEEPPNGYQICSDGRCIGENLRREGETYTLTGNVNCPIAILRDNVVLDGAGYEVQGSGASAGVWLQNRIGVTIKNLKIDNFEYGIKFSYPYHSAESTKNCNITSNRITNCQTGITTGMLSTGCRLVDNYIADNVYGVTIGYSSNVLINNRFERNHYAVLDNGYWDNNFGTSNTIDGKPIYYWVNRHDTTVPSNAGMVVLRNCTNVLVKNLLLDETGNGMLLVNTNSSTLINNKISQNFHGIILRSSFGNTVSNNTVTNNTSSGIDIGYEDNRAAMSSENNISENIVIGNGIGLKCGINSTISSNQILANGEGIIIQASCKVTKNNVTENLGNGILLEGMFDSIVSGNIVTLNKGYGIGLGAGPNGMVKDNFISKNDVGIWINSAYQNTILSNEVSQNKGFGIRFEGNHYDNLIYRNNFINNNNGGIQASIELVWHYDLNPGYIGKKPYQSADGPANSWDNGKEGNYWSNYDGSGSYYINANNRDNHPLLAPLEFSRLELPATEFPSQESDSDSGLTNVPDLLANGVMFAVICAAVVVLLGICLLIHYRFKLKRRRNS